MHEKLLRSWLFIKKVLISFNNDGCMYRSAALTYTSLLALVPLMTVSFAVLSAFPVFKGVGMEIQNFVFHNFVAASGEVIQNYLQSFSKQTANLSLIGSAFLVVTSVMLMTTIEQAFNDIWRVRTRRHWMGAFMLYWSTLSLAPILMGLGFAVSSYFASLPLISGTADDLGLREPLLRLTPFFISTIVFTWFNLVLPNCRVRFHQALCGGVVSALLFEGAKAAFAYYISHFPTYTLIYGALATIPIFLVWMYLSWLIILFGAEVSHALSRRYEYRLGIKLDGFTQVFRWIGYLWQAQQSGSSMRLEDIIALDPYNYQVEPERQIQLLTDANIIQRTDDGCYVLVRDLNEVSLQDLYRDLPWQLPSAGQVAQYGGLWQKTLEDVLDQSDQANKSILNIPLAQLYHQSQQQSDNCDKIGEMDISVRKERSGKRGD